jgi:hypothetical protein
LFSGRHVFGKRGAAATIRRARMAGDTLPLGEYLDCLAGDARIDQFLDETEGRRIPMTVDFDVVVGGDTAALPDGEGIGFARQILQRRRVDAREQFGPARTEAFHEAGVDVADEFGDGDVEIGDGEETPIALPVENSPFGDQDRLLDFGLVARLVRPRRTNRRAVMIREFEIAAVQARLVAILVGDGGFPCDVDPDKISAVQPDKMKA